MVQAVLIFIDPTVPLTRATSDTSVLLSMSVASFFAGPLAAVKHQRLLFPSRGCLEFVGLWSVVCSCQEVSSQPQLPFRQPEYHFSWRPLAPAPIQILEIQSFVKSFGIYVLEHQHITNHTLKHTKLHQLSYTILYYTILYYTILYYTIRYDTILYYTILYYTILYYTILYYTIPYHTILYYTIPYHTILY